MSNKREEVTVPMDDPGSDDAHNASAIDSSSSHLMISSVCEFSGCYDAIADSSMDTCEPMPEECRENEMAEVSDDVPESSNIVDEMDISPTASSLSSDAISPFHFGCSLRSTTVLNMECSTSSSVREPVGEFIPQFFFPNGRSLSDEMRKQLLFRIDQLFGGQLGALEIQGFRTVTKEICRLPSFLSSSIFRRIDSYSTGIVTRNAFIDYWVNSNLITMDRANQIFRILKRPENKYLTQDDFKPVLYDFLATNPALGFLKDNHEFQESYAKTVIYRIFYHNNRAGDGRLTLGDVKRGNLVSALQQADEKNDIYHNNRAGDGRLTLGDVKRGNLVSALQQADEKNDINEVLSYFSYMHFYVIWCNFYELDDDNDFLIDKEDLRSYGEYSLTNRIVDRIFSQAARKFTSAVEGKMGYEDFVYFILSEEDKSSEPSIQYWFKCIDLDGNGVLTPDELMFFYEEQVDRMKSRCFEYLRFEDIFCEMLDMIRPENATHFTLRDVKKCKLSGHFFNTLFNVDKYIAFSTHNPILMRERQSLALTEWDRFAAREYLALSRTEEAYEDLYPQDDTTVLRL